MNFLAHFFLGKNTEENLLGNFIGDFVKGSDYNLYSQKVKGGILMHRFIDSYTDSHPLVIEAKRKLGGEFGHYSGVVVDVFYDYFLASNWTRFSSVKLTHFIGNCYETLNKYQEDMPFSAQVTYRHMVKNDWLNRYTNLVGLQKTFIGLNQYLKRDTGMEDAVKSLLEHKEFLNDNFLQFFPELEHAVSSAKNKQW